MDELVSILGTELPIRPSPEFTSSVMQAIRREAESPPTLPFPWLKVPPGALAAGLLLLGGLIALPHLPALPGSRAADPVGELAVNVPAEPAAHLVSALSASCLCLRLFLPIAGDRP
ncbi:MAG: hypothetical protein ACE5JR_11685 [Gemmatimonadota bacterium]